MNCVRLEEHRNTEPEFLTCGICIKGYTLWLQCVTVFCHSMTIDTIVLKYSIMVGHPVVLRGHSITTWTRWGGEGSNNVCFCPRSGYKNCPRRGWGVKMAKFLPRSCWMPPNVGELLWVPISSPPSLLHWHSGICFDTVPKVLKKMLKREILDLNVAFSRKKKSRVSTQYWKLPLRNDRKRKWTKNLIVGELFGVPVLLPVFYCIDTRESALTQCIRCFDDFFWNNAFRIHVCSVVCSQHQLIRWDVYCISYVHCNAQISGL